MFQICDVCKVQINEHDFPSHLLGKRHLKKVESENFKKGLIERSIFVSRIPPGLGAPDITDFFAQFGRIERCRLESNFATIEFKNKEPVNFLLNRPIWMGRHKLEIEKRNCTANQQKTPEEEKTRTGIIFADLKTKLQTTTTFDSELGTFLEEVGLNAEEVESKWESLHSSLRDTFQSAFPYCEISRFGSSVTGLGFKGSDFDIFLDIGLPIYEEKKDGGWTPRGVFKKVKFLLYQKKHIFESIILIPKAKTPIIKFYHAPTTTNCDLSFKNGLGVINSQLIKQLLCLDVRIKPLMIILKFWAKNFELTGSGKFTNYALVMMIIFYLQQPETKLLPPILELQKTCEPVYRWNWQVNFDRNAVLPPSSNTSTITELLHGFFNFYRTFPFEKNLISPLDGCSHLKTEFIRTWREKGADADYLSLSRPICIQDPIDLTNNVTAGVSTKLLETLQSFCTAGSEVCETALQNKDKPFLLSLFTTLPLPLRRKKQKFHDIVISATKTLHVGVPKDFHTRTDIEDKKQFMEENWYALAQRLTEETFRRVFKLEVQPVKMIRESKQQKVAATSDVHSNDNNEIVLECIGSHNVIFGRKAKGFCIDPTLSPIEKQALISDEIVKKQEENTAKLDFTCTIIREKNPVRLVLRLNDRSDMPKQFWAFAVYLDNKLPSIVDKELIHMLQYNKC